MKYKEKTKEQLINELEEMRQPISKLEAVETEHKQAETIPAVAEENYQRLFELAPIGVTILDMKGMILYCNSAVYDKGGYTKGEFTGKHFSKIPSVRVKDIPTYIRLFNSIVRGKIPQSFEATYQRKDGTTGWTELNIGLIKIGRKRRILVMQHDITERKRAEEALCESEENFRALAENAFDGILVGTGTEGRHVYANQRAAEITGYSVAELLKTSIKDLVPPGESKTLMERYKARFEGKHVPTTYETVIVRKDGKSVPIELTGSKTLWQRKTADLVSFRDITGRKQVEESLKGSEQSYRELAEGISDPFFAMDKDLRCTYWNKASEKLTGVLAKDAVGKYVYDIVPDLELTRKQQAKEVFLKAMRTKQSQQLVSEYQFGGKDFVFEISLYPSQDGFSIFAKDITERKQAEETLQKSEQDYRELAESISDVFFAMDKELRLIYWNKASEELTGVSAKDALGKHAYDLFPDMEATRKVEAKESYLKAIRTKQPQQFVIEYQFGGKDFIFEISAYPSQDGVSVFVKDITKHKQAERELELRAQLLDAATDSIALHDFGGKFIYVNEAAYKSHGYTKDELMGMKTHDLTAPEYAKSAEPLMREVQKKGEIIMQTVHLRKDKSTMPIEVHAKVIEWGGIKLCLSVARDITERKKAEEALKGSEQSYRELAESISDPFFALNKELRFTYWNKASEKFTGVSAKDALGKYAYDIFLGKIELGEVYQKTIRTKQPQQFLDEYQFGGKDFVFEINAYPSQDGISVFAKDITERKQTERELELKAQLLDAATDSIVLSDFEGKFVYVNEAACRLHGYTKDELMVMGVYELITPEYAKFMESGMKEIQKGEIKIQLVHLRKDKSTIPMEVHSKIVKLGGVKFYLSVARDITERKMAEEKIKLFSSAVAGAIDGIAITDVKGTITYINPAMEELYGYKKDEILGKSIINLHTDSETEMGKDLMSTLLRTGNWSGEIRAIKKNKETFPVSLSLSTVVDEQGNPIALMGTIRDITERKQAETVMKESLAEKETLLKEVHHRVKNNMQVISSLLRLQAARVKDKDFAAILKDSQNRIQSMALVYNKLYQSQNLASINMTDYIKELTVGLIKSYTTSPYRVTARIDPSNVFLGVDMAIPCGLVINELVVNSLKYAFPENSTGQIAISLKDGSNQELELVVSDNGVGIPEGINPANTSTLGLKLVTNLVQDQLDGKIELDRSQGTTFKITFRRAKEKK